MPLPIHSLYTVVQNSSGAKRFFHFLGQRGVWLEIDGQYEHPGDLVTILAMRGGLRDFTAFEKAIEAGDLVIIRSPLLYIRDLTTDIVKNLEADEGTLELSTPVEGDYYASDPA